MNTETREKLRRLVLDVAAVLEITREPAELVQSAMTLRDVAERILNIVALETVLAPNQRPGEVE
jgi:coenzyme F420-reducing hydrogenase alpha subunit